MAYGVTGNTSGFGPEESRFDPQQANKEQILANEINYCIFAQLINENIMRGLKVPSFYSRMLKEKIDLLLSDCFDQRPDLFLIDFSISENNEISVSIDGDNGVKVEDCMFISREIEGNLDRDEIDFSLKVASCGATSPLIKARQYSKHYGRTLSIKTSDDQYEGKLTSANEKFINIVWKVREPKLIGKGKITVEKSIDIDYNQIKEAKVKVKF